MRFVLPLIKVLKMSSLFYQDHNWDQDFFFKTKMKTSSSRPRSCPWGDSVRWVQPADDWNAQSGGNNIAVGQWHKPFDSGRLVRIHIWQMKMPYTERDRERGTETLWHRGSRVWLTCVWWRCEMRRDHMTWQIQQLTEMTPSTEPPTHS